MTPSISPVHASPTSSLSPSRTPFPPLTLRPIHPYISASFLRFHCPISSSMSVQFRVVFGNWDNNVFHKGGHYKVMEVKRPEFKTSIPSPIWKISASQSSVSLSAYLHAQRLSSTTNQHYSYINWFTKIKTNCLEDCVVSIVIYFLREIIGKKWRRGAEVFKKAASEVNKWFLGGGGEEWGRKEGRVEMKAESLAPRIHRRESNRYKLNFRFGSWRNHLQSSSWLTKVSTSCLRPAVKERLCQIPFASTFPSTREIWIWLEQLLFELRHVFILKATVGGGDNVHSRKTVKQFCDVSSKALQNWLTNGW